MCSYFSKLDESKCREIHGSKYYELFAEQNTPIMGCSAGIGVYPNTEYPPLGVHQDNEGFYVVCGSGTGIVGAQEQAIVPGSFFYVPAGEPHAVKKDVDAEDLKVLLFHFPKM